MFDGYPAKTRDFYSKIVWMMWLNAEAYKRGYFDTLLSDTDDIFSWFRFVEMLPDIKMWMAIDEDLGFA